MDFSDKLYDLASKVDRLRGSLATEEATKNALVMPFIRLLGYDVFNPEEVVPEFVADVLQKKGEKVDYAILKDGSPIILIECKCCGVNLDEVKANQLYRYFTATEARIAILTDGVRYLFYTDLEQPNVMDEKPFMVFDLDKIDESLIPELKKFAKEKFDLERALNSANELKYTREIRKEFEREYKEPSKEFVRLFASRVYQGKLMPNVMDQFDDIVKSAFHNFLSEMINDRLKSALIGSEKQEIIGQEEDEVEEVADDNGIITTEEELEGYYIKTSARQTHLISLPNH